MKIQRTVTERTFYVLDGMLEYRVTHRFNDPPYDVRRPEGTWTVESYKRTHWFLCDPDKATHKRVVKAVQEVLTPTTELAA